MYSAMCPLGRVVVGIVLVWSAAFSSPVVVSAAPATLRLGALFPLSGERRREGVGGSGVRGWVTMFPVMMGVCVLLWLQGLGPSGMLAAGTQRHSLPSTT